MKLFDELVVSARESHSAQVLYNASSLLILFDTKSFEMIDLELDLLEIVINLLETNQVLSSLGIPHSTVFLNEVIGKVWLFKPPCQFLEGRRLDVAL